MVLNSHHNESRNISNLTLYIETECVKLIKLIILYY